MRLRPITSPAGWNQRLTLDDKNKKLNGAGQGVFRPLKPLRPLRRMLPYLGRHKANVFAAVIFLGLAAGTTLLVPLAVRQMIDHGFSGAGPAYINSYFLILLGLAVILALASAGRYYFVITISEQVIADIRRDLFSHLTRLSPGFYDQEKSGDIISRLTADTTQIKAVFGSTASLMLRNLILGLGAFVMMTVTSARLSSLVIIAIPVMVLPLMMFGRSVRARAREAQDRLADATAYASEAVSSIRTLQAFVNEKLVSDRFAAAVDDAYEAARGSTKSRSVLTAFAIFAIFGSVVAVLWFGARSVLDGSITTGTLGQFLLYSVFAATSLATLSEAWSEVSQAAGAAERIAEILDERPAIEAPARPAPLPVTPVGSLVFENVTFAYPARPDADAVQALDFRVQPGETVAIVGPSGAGKSTLYSLLLRFYDPQQGRILVDGVDIKAADPQEVRRRIALVSQDVTVFAASARENIAFGRPGASDAEIEAAAEAASADGFILALDKGYDSELGERGVMLSGGQRQRIAIARAVLKDAPILLLDEATSALDAESETAVQKALEGLMRGRTTLVIAHRLATILKADRILVMDQGRIVEEGTHKSLVRKGGVYARLARLQFDAGAVAGRAAAE
jgi:ATP-binding cassette, subfamily B, bacterial